ncbi:MAG: HNH endonuclease [Proteobacteria bacterium]|nr:HNH endonuclease [Pseudomonadota bacterium]
MKFWVGVTDNRWYEFLYVRRPDEVNFWQPSATPPFTGASIGMPFLFKLKRPHNHIAGGGFFVTYSTLPLPLAWEIFGEKNGASSMEELRELVEPLSGKDGLGTSIGCTVLANPLFLPREAWFEPAGWSPNIVRGKMYDSDETAGAAVWAMASHQLDPPRVGIVPASHFLGDVDQKFGAPVLVRPRLGQSSFRVMLTEAYKRRCAITGEHTLIALEAAHIVPYSKEGEHDVRNGMLLRADFHRLYDAGLVSVTPDLKVKVSPKIREAYFNGKSYYRLDGYSLEQIPDNPELRPDPDRLNWHYKNLFQA